MRWITIGLMACAPPLQADPPDPTVATALVVATSADDYSVGALTVVDLDAPSPRDVATIHGDAVVQVHGHDVYVIERLLVDAVRHYAEGTWAAPAWQASTGRASNPHAVARCGGRLFVSRYELPGLAILDPATGALLGEVDLGDEADADGLPEASDLVVFEDRLFVGLQRLDRDQAWSSAPGGRLVEVDCSSGEPVATWPIGPNPVLVPHPDGLMAVAEDGLRAFHGAEPGPPVHPTLDGARLVDASFGADGRGVLVAREADRHVVACLDADGTLRPGFATPRYLADVLVTEGQAWLAARRGWRDPDTPGAILRMDLDRCAVDEEMTTTLAPFSLAIRHATLSNASP